MSHVHLSCTHKNHVGRQWVNLLFGGEPSRVKTHVRPHTFLQWRAWPLRTAQALRQGSRRSRRALRPHRLASSWSNLPALRMAALIAGMAQGLQGLFGDLIDRWCHILPNSVSRRLREGFVAGPHAHDAARFCRGFLVRARTPAIRSCSA